MIKPMAKNRPLHTLGKYPLLIMPVGLRTRVQKLTFRMSSILQDASGTRCRMETTATVSTASTEYSSTIYFTFTSIDQCKDSARFPG